MVEKVVTTVDRYKDSINEIQQIYVLGFTPYRIHTNPDGTFVTPIHAYDGRAYVLDNVATMRVTDWYIAMDDNSKLIYFVKGDDDGGTGFALHGDRGPSGATRLKGDSSDRGVAGSRGPTGKCGAVGPRDHPGKIGKVGPVGASRGARSHGEQGDEGDSGGVHQGPTG